MAMDGYARKTSARVISGGGAAGDTFIGSGRRHRKGGASAPPSHSYKLKAESYASPIPSAMPISTIPIITAITHRYWLSFSFSFTNTRLSITLTMQ